MNENAANLTACVLVALGLCSQAWLLGVFVSDWRQAMRGQQSRVGRKHSVNRVSAAAMAALGIGFVSAAHAEPDPGQSPTQQPAPATSPTAELPGEADKPLVISTDRPSFDDTAGIVPKGHFQLETGYTFTLNNHRGTNTQANNAPEILARYTIIEDRFELRLSTSGFVWTRTETAGGGSSADGFSDILPGFKLKLTDQEGWMPRLVLEGATTVGVGTDGISNQDVEPIGKLIWQYDLGKGWGVYGNFNVAYATTSGSGRFVQGQAGVCVTYAPTDKLSFYGEFFTFAPNAKGTSPAYYLDAGGAYLITNRVQLDARVGFGLGRQSNSFFTGAGVSFLF